MQMAADIVQELCLDEDFVDSESLGKELTEEELDKIRAYLTYIYLVST